MSRFAAYAVALVFRAVIGQAKGMFRGRFTVDPDQVFQLLTRVSRQSNPMVRDVAERFVRAGELRPS